MEKEILQTYTKEICPGVYLERYYTDTTKVYGNDPVEEKWTLRIDYCLAGRFEAEFTENRHSYIESGQFAINTTDYDIVSSASLLNDSISKGYPAKLTGARARTVRGSSFSFASALTGSRQRVLGSMSAKTGSAPT